MKANPMVALACIGFSILIMYRAYAIPFTHDEATTWNYLRHTDIVGCFFQSDCWGSANHHWLNTLLLQLSAVIGGDIPWVLRMPNVLAGWAYFLVAALIVHRYLKNNWAQLFGFLLITAHVYLLDFFSLARGYGLMVSFILLAIYCLLRYIEKFEIKWFLIILLSLFLSVLSNFTALISVAAILGSWFLWIILQNRFYLLWLHGRFVFIYSIALFFLLKVPIRILASTGEFEWGASGLNEMAKDLFYNIWTRKQHLGNHDTIIIMYLLLTILLVCFSALLIRFKVKSYPPLSMLFLLTGNILFVILLMQGFTDSKIPIGRKSIFLIPYFFCALALCQSLIHKKSISTITGVIGSVLILIQLFSILPKSLKSVREWYYDAYYPELFSAIIPEKNESDSVSLGASWIFIPSLTFYQKSQSLPISGLEYQKKLIVDTTMQYYYLEPSDTSGILDAYHFEKTIGMFHLYKKR